MEKLIELLNEYGTQKQANANWKEFLEEEKNQIYLIFGMDFVKWLVENDKIDRSKVLEEIGSCIKISGLGPHYSFYSALLMILAVSDTPIEDLISYLR